MGTDWQSGSPKGTDWQRDSDGHTDWQRNANQGTDWQPKPKPPAQSKARVDARRKNKYLGINKIIDRANRKKRGKGRIGPAANRDKINKGIGVARPSGASLGSGGALTNPLTEEYNDGALGYWDMVSSDGLFTFEYLKEITYTDADGAGDSYTWKQIDPDFVPPP